MVRIEATLWAVNIEAHIKSSDWHAYQHQHDDDYSNIILHVVYEHDKTVVDKDGLLILTIELKNKIEEDRYSKCQYFVNNTNWIQCSKVVSLVDPITKTSWLERMLVERLGRKSEAIEKVLLRNKNDWEVSFYQILPANFEFKVNEQPSRMLTTMMPLHILQKHRDNQMQIEVLLMAQAGLL